MDDQEEKKLELPIKQNFENKGGIYYSYGKNVNSPSKKDLTKCDVIKKYTNRFKLR